MDLPSVPAAYTKFPACLVGPFGKSRRCYGPMGPLLVTVDEVDDPENL